MCLRKTKLDELAFETFDFPGFLLKCLKSFKIVLDTYYH